MHEVSRRQFKDQVDSYFRQNGRNKSFRLRDKNKAALVRKLMHKVYSRSTVLFCVDVEAWEKNTKTVTEIGISIYDPKGQELALFPVIESYHILIAENSHRKNGRYVPDHSLNFSGSTTYRLGKDAAARFVHQLFEKYFYSGAHDATMVGHAVKGDLHWLRDMGIDASGFSNGTYPVFDTQTIYAQSYGLQGASLRNALHMLSVPHAFLHNAGNDAYYTVLLALRLCDPTVRDRLSFDQRLGGDSVKYRGKLGHNVCYVKEPRYSESDPETPLLDLRWEESEPKETEPEETEPKETEPKETEPKETEPKETRD